MVRYYLDPERSAARSIERARSRADAVAYRRELMAMTTRPTSYPTTCLSGGLVDLGDRVRLLHSRYRLGPGHQHGRLGGLEGAPCGNGQRDGGHALIVRHVGDDGEIVVTKAIPTTNEF